MLLKRDFFANNHIWVDNKISMSKDQSTPNVTIVVPYYRRPLTLKQTLRLLTQVDYPLSKLEVIIVDDGSPSDEAPSVSEFQTLVDIKVLYQEDLGYRVSSARNLGISNAKHEIIIILDCDLGVEKSFICDHIDILNTSPYVISIGLRTSYSAPNLDRILETSDLATTKSFAEFLSSDWRLTSLKDPTYKDSNSCWRLCSGGNIGFHKSVLKMVGDFDERFNFWGGEDTEWAYRAYKKGIFFYVIDKCHAAHFECQANEYQVSRYSEFESKHVLLKELVPRYENSHFCKGEVPFVSILVTHFNKLEYLKQCLMSILDATLFRYEIVLVDDCSQCCEKDIFEQIPLEMLEHLTFYRNPTHQGVERTLKTALELCRGEFIAQLDADDYLLPHAIDRLIDALDSQSVDLAYGKHKVLDGETLTEGWICETASRQDRILKGMHYHPLRVFRARALHRAGGFRQLGLEGAVDFSLYSLLEIYCEAVFVDTFTYVYRKTKGSITDLNFQAQVSGVLKVIEDNAQLLAQDSDFKITQLGLRAYDVKFSDANTLLVKEPFSVRY